MGHRANMIIVREDGSISRRSTHYSAIHFDRALFWGPDLALQFIESCDSSGAFSEVDAEGGVVLDLRKRHLRWFGGYRIMEDTGLRRVLLGIMRPLWPGWTISWAFEQISDIEGYFGGTVDEDKLVEPPEGLPTEAEVHDDALSVLSMVDEHGLRMTLHHGAAATRLAFAGPQLLELIQQQPELPHLSFDGEFVDAHPTGGVHVDTRSRVVAFWSSSPQAEATRRLAARWPGWTTQWWEDRYEDHLAVLGGRVVWSEPELEQQIWRVRRIAFSGLRGGRDYDQYETDGDDFCHETLSRRSEARPRERLAHGTFEETHDGQFAEWFAMAVREFLASLNLEPDSWFGIRREQDRD